MSWLTQNKDKVTITISVVPRSSRSEIVGVYNDCLKIKIKAPPHDNEANEELIRFLSKSLNVPKLSIEIIKGHTQKKKIITVFNCTIDKLQYFHENM